MSQTSWIIWLIYLAQKMSWADHFRFMSWAEPSWREVSISWAELSRAGGRSQIRELSWAELAQLAQLEPKIELSHSSFHLYLVPHRYCSLLTSISIHSMLIEIESSQFRRSQNHCHRNHCGSDHHVDSETRRRMTTWTIQVQLNDQAANEFNGKSNRLASECNNVFPISWSDSLQKKRKKIVIFNLT